MLLLAPFRVRSRNWESMQIQGSRGACAPVERLQLLPHRSPHHFTSPIHPTPRPFLVFASSILYTKRDDEVLIAHSVELPNRGNSNVVRHYLETGGTTRPSGTCPFRSQVRDLQMANGVAGLAFRDNKLCFVLFHGHGTLHQVISELRGRAIAVLLYCTVLLK